MMLCLLGHSGIAAGGSDPDTVQTIIRGLEHNEALVPRGRGIYVARRLTAKQFRTPPETIASGPPDGGVGSAWLTKPAASVWVVSWAFDGARFRQDAETVLPLAGEGRTWHTTVHAYDGQRAFLYIAEASRCLIAPSPHVLYLDAIWHLWPGNNALLMPTMLGRCFGPEPIGELMRACNAQITQHSAALGQESAAQTWVLTGERPHERWQFWVEDDHGFRLRKVQLSYGSEGEPPQPSMGVTLADFQRVGPDGGWLPSRGVLRVHVPGGDGALAWRDTYSVEMRKFTTELPDRATIFTLDTFLPAGTDVLQTTDRGWELVETVGDDVLGYAARVAKSLRGRDDFSAADE